MAVPITATIGCDLGDKKSSLFILHADDREERCKPVPTEREAFRKWFTREPCLVGAAPGLGGPVRSGGTQGARCPGDDTNDARWDLPRDGEGDGRAPAEVHGGVVSSHRFLTLEDKARFKKSRSVGAFVGLRSRKKASGDSDLRRWGLELAKRGGKNARKRAKVAVARKLAVLMHRLWVTGEVYEPLRRAQRTAA